MEFTEQREVSRQQTNPAAETTLPAGLTIPESSGSLVVMDFASSFSTSIELNDLWTYDPNINQWMWVSGDSIAGAQSVYETKGISSPTNKPGHRHMHQGWCDANGNMWVFAGATEVSNVYQYLNDLWKYDTVKDQWAWVNGESFLNSSGNYG